MRYWADLERFSYGQLCEQLTDGAAIVSTHAEKVLWAFWNPKESRLRAGWRILLHLVAALGLYVSFVVFIAVVFQPAETTASLITLGAVVPNIIVIATVFLACVWPDRRRIRGIGLDISLRWWLDLFGGLALGAVLMGLIFAVQYLNGWIEIGESDSDVGQTVKLQVGWVLAMAFIGTGEEILSRGYHLKNLTEGFKRTGIVTSFVIASLMSSGAFGLVHGLNPNSSRFATASVMMAGIMFCMGRLMTGSLAAPIGMHIAWNYCQGAVFGFPVSGMTIQGSLVQIDSTVDSIWTGGDFGPEASLPGLFAIITATVVFVLWPGSRADWKTHLVQIARFRRRVPLRGARIDQAPCDAEQHPRDYLPPDGT